MCTKSPLSLKVLFPLNVIASFELPDICYDSGECQMISAENRDSLHPSENPFLCVGKWAQVRTVHVSGSSYQG